jgi:hypothetical protein
LKNMPAKISTDKTFLIEKLFIADDIKATLDK